MKAFRSNIRLRRSFELYHLYPLQPPQVNFQSSNPLPSLLSVTKSCWLFLLWTSSCLRLQMYRHNRNVSPISPIYHLSLIFPLSLSHSYFSNFPTSRKRVFILGPSHHVYLDGCALTKCERYDTPIGELFIDKESEFLLSILSFLKTLICFEKIFPCKLILKSSDLFFSNDPQSIQSSIQQINSLKWTSKQMKMNIR